MAIDKFIQHRTAHVFIPRNPIEKSRNCTQLDRNLIETIVRATFEALLNIESYVEKPGKDDARWNRGGEISLETLSQKLASNDLKLLKSECGGLQTLLRNHRYIFKVIGGSVSLREPLNRKDTSAYRDKPCWFNNNHPDGCLFDANDCACQH